MEMVSSCEISHIHINCMIAGHTKFDPDRLFASIGSAYKVADVFTIEELNTICAQSTTTFVEDGENVLTWRENLGKKYSNLPGVRKFHDFHFVRSQAGFVVMKDLEKCFSGAWKHPPCVLLMR